MSDLKPGDPVTVTATGTDHRGEGYFLGPRPDGPPGITYSAVWFEDDGINEPERWPAVVDHGGCSPWTAVLRKEDDG